LNKILGAWPNAPFASNSFIAGTVNMIAFFRGAAFFATHGGTPTLALVETPSIATSAGFWFMLYAYYQQLGFSL